MTQMIPMTMENLASMDDGKLGVLVKHALLGICRDCVNRPTNPTVRKLNIELMFRPVADGPDLKHVEWWSQIKSKVPALITAPGVVRADMSGFKVPEEGESALADE